MNIECSQLGILGDLLNEKLEFHRAIREDIKERHQAIREDIRERHREHLEDRMERHQGLLGHLLPSAVSKGLGASFNLGPFGFSGGLTSASANAEAGGGYRGPGGYAGGNSNVQASANAEAQGNQESN